MRILDLFCGAGGAAIERRFWSHVDRGADEECWEWTGALDDPESADKPQPPVRAEVTP